MTPILFDGEGTFFGYVILNGDTMNAEWGYFSWGDLKEVRLWGMEVVLDCKWTVRRFGDIGIGTAGRDGV